MPKEWAEVEDLNLKIDHSKNVRTDNLPENLQTSELPT
jgi:hypothetical protein